MGFYAFESSLYHVIYFTITAFLYYNHYSVFQQLLSSKIPDFCGQNRAFYGNKVVTKSFVIRKSIFAIKKTILRVKYTNFRDKIQTGKFLWVCLNVGKNFW